MAGKSIYDQLEESLAHLAEAIPDENTLSKKWGTYLEVLTKTIRCANFLVETLKGAPTLMMPAAFIQSLPSYSENTRTAFISIRTLNDTISVESPYAEATREANCSAATSKVLQEVQDFLRQVSPWVGFITLYSAKSHGMAKIVADARTEVERLRAEHNQFLEDRRTELTGLVTKAAADSKQLVTDARQQAGIDAAAQFTTIFGERGEKLGKQSWKWLVAALVFLAGTAGLALYFYEDAKSGNEPNLPNLLLAKITILGLGVSAAIWCGRHYKSLLHRSEVYLFKSHALQNFQAFMRTGASEATRDAVLTETARSIFSSYSTGLVGESGDNDGKLLEVVQNTFQK